MSDEEKSVAIRQEPSDRPGTIAGIIRELARDPSFDAAKFIALGDFQLRMEDRAADRELADAIQAIQSEIPPVPKNGKIPKKDKNGDTTYIPFAAYEDVMAVLQPFLNQHKIAVTYSTEFTNLKMVITAVARKGTATVTASIPMPIDEGPGRNSAQAHVSSTSYGKRNALESLFNIIRTGADDDGNTADRKLLTAEQVAELDAMLQAGGGSEAALLVHYYGDQYRSLDEVPVGEYAKLKKAIDSRNRAVAAKKGEGQ